LYIHIYLSTYLCRIKQIYGIFFSLWTVRKLEMSKTQHEITFQPPAQKHDKEKIKRSIKVHSQQYLQNCIIAIANVLGVNETIMLNISVSNANKQIFLYKKFSSCKTLFNRKSLICLSSTIYVFKTGFSCH
jgi:hypothetical protein